MENYRQPSASKQINHLEIFGPAVSLQPMSPSDYQQPSGTTNHIFPWQPVLCILFNMAALGQGFFYYYIFAFGG